jgi:hypothetical protein
MLENAIAYDLFSEWITINDKEKENLKKHITASGNEYLNTDMSIFGDDYTLLGELYITNERTREKFYHYCQRRIVELENDPTRGGQYIQEITRLVDEEIFELTEEEKWIQEAFFKRNKHKIKKSG